MSASTPARPRAPRPLPTSNINRGAASRDRLAQASPAPRGERATSPVTPVEFVEPEGPSSPASVLHHPHANRGENAMRRLRSPFTWEAA